MRGSEEHALVAPPVLVLTTEGRGWTVACTCGWESETFPAREAADLAGGQHVAAPAPVKPRRFGRRSISA
jgi:hypothetical protein